MAQQWNIMGDSTIAQCERLPIPQFGDRRSRHAGAGDRRTAIGWWSEQASRVRRRRRGDIPKVGEIAGRRPRRSDANGQHGGAMTVTVTALTSGSSALDSSSVGRAPVRVVLASDLSLIAEAVGAALASRGFHVAILAWPRVPVEAPVHQQ